MHDTVFSIVISVLCILRVGAQNSTADACINGKTVSGTNGTIQSPNYPNMYPRNSNCNWTIETPANTRISVKFEVLYEIEGYSPGCPYDYVAILDGSNELKLCGKQIPTSYLSSTNTLGIGFITDDSVSELGFSLNWTAVDAATVPDAVTTSVTVDVDGGTIESPDYPNDYSSNLMIVHYLEANEGQGIKLQFNPNFTIEGSVTDNCPYDFLEIYDGNASNRSLLRTLCGNTQPDTEYINSHQVIIVFQTDATNAATGFSLRYSTLIAAPQCADVAYINGTEGVITSSFYPLKYGSSENCTWFITAPEKKLIAVKFNQPFDLPFLCSDFVRMFDGPSTSSPQIFSQDFCGQYAPRNFLSSSNFLTVVFKSSSSYSLHGQGFSFNWTTEDACDPNEFHCWTGNCINGTLQCDGHEDCIPDGADEAECSNTNATTCGIPAVSPDFQLDARIVGGTVAADGSWPWQIGLWQNRTGRGRFICGGVLLSPKWAVTAAHCISPVSDYPLFVILGDYDASEIGNREQVINVKEAYIHPNYDFRTSFGFVYGHDIAMLHLNVPAIRTLWIREVCLPPPNLEPITGEFVVVTGWGQLDPTIRKLPSLLNQVRVKVVSYEECNKYFKRDLEDGGIPEFDLAQNIICVGLESGGAGACFGDSGGPIVENIDGSWVLIGLTSFGLGCGKIPMTPGQMTKVSNFIPYIEGYLNGSSLERNIQNINISQNNGTIFSPNYGASVHPWYPQNVIIIWRITSDANTRLLVRFNSSFHIEFKSKCTKDYLRIYDGNSITAPKYLKRDLCGSTAPSDFESETNEIIVEFSTDSTFEYIGFSFSWVATEDCTKDQYRCFDMSCIPLSQKCDNNTDCSNMDDEIECARAPETATCGVQEIVPDFPRNVFSIGGSNAKEGAWPWQANIFAGNRFICGGTLISSQWILTSGYCIDRLGFSNTTVKLGDYNLAMESDRQKSFGADSIVNHPDYTPSDETWNNVGLIKLNESVSFTQWIKPLCLPQRNSSLPPPGTTCVVTGHGTTESTSSMPTDILQQLQVIILSDEECLIEYKKMRPSYNDTKVPESVICARGPSRTSPCSTDSGGPLQCVSDNTWKIFGLITSVTGCKDNVVFLNVISTLPFIDLVMAFEQCRENETLIGDSGVLTLPTIGGKYHSGAKCSWLIQASPNKLLEVRFIYFDVEEPCIFDFVAIYDGSSTDDRQFLDQKLCGTNKNIRSFESSTNAIVVTFQSDGSNQYRGFQLTWKAVDDCASHEFRCLDQGCIPSQKKCDGIPDCADKSDEMQCKLEKQDCGTPDVEVEFQWAQLIVGGSEVVPGTWPWQVGIVSFSGNEPFCGGTLIHPRFVLTAAHCVAWVQDPDEINVVVGEHDLSITDDNAVYIPVNEIHIHASYLNEVGYDIALLELAEHATLNKYVQTLCIVDNDAVPVGDYCVATGWGSTEIFVDIVNGAYLPILRQVRLRILDEEICRNATDDYNEDRMVCAGNFDAGGVDTCQGDSGGPLACLGNNRWYLLGITSFGRGCGQPQSPGYYTNAPFFYDWIKNITDPPAPPTEDCVRTCIATDASSSREDKMSRWVCELVNWRCGMSGWMSTFITWWDGCIESDNVELWQGRFTCPSNNTFQCCSGEQMCFRDAFRCNICHCVKGTYKYASRLINIWDKDQEIYQERVDFYNRYKDSCTQRDLEDECPA